MDTRLREKGEYGKDDTSKHLILSTAQMYAHDFFFISPYQCNDSQYENDCELEGTSIIFHGYEGRIANLAGTAALLANVAATACYPLWY